MPQELFYLCSAIGILLTFAASITAVVVSIVSMKSSKRTAEQTNYLNTITVERAKWQASMKELSAKYFTQIARLCGGQEFILNEIVNELITCHFAIVLHLFKGFERDENLHNEMSAIRKKAKRIVEYDSIISCEYLKAGLNSKIISIEIENKDIVSSARHNIYELRLSILNDHQDTVFNIIRELIEIEWRKQLREAKSKKIWKEIINDGGVMN